MVALNFLDMISIILMNIASATLNQIDSFGIFCHYTPKIIFSMPVIINILNGIIASHHHIKYLVNVKGDDTIYNYN